MASNPHLDALRNKHRELDKKGPAGRKTSGIKLCRNCATKALETPFERADCSLRG